MNLNITILGQIISFILFVWFCMKYIWYPIIDIIMQRQKEISDQLLFAKNTKEESKRMSYDAKNCLDQAKIKAQEIVQKAYVYKTQILNEAQRNIDQERRSALLQTKCQIIQEKKRVIEELRGEISMLIADSVEKFIKISMNEEINKEFVDNIINKLSCKE